MSGIVQREATYADYLALLAGLGIERPTRGLRCVAMQIAWGRAWAFETAANVPPLALGGICHGPEESEAWFVSGPGAEAAMVPLVRVFRRQISADRRLIGRPVVARVSQSNPAGARLACAIGLQRSAIEGGVVDVWTTD